MLYVPLPPAVVGVLVVVVVVVVVDSGRGQFAIPIRYVNTIAVYLIQVVMVKLFLFNSVLTSMEHHKCPDEFEIVQVVYSMPR